MLLFSYDFMSHFFFFFLLGSVRVRGLLLVKKETTIFQEQFFIYMLHISWDCIIFRMTIQNLQPLLGHIGEKQELFQMAAAL